MSKQEREAGLSLQGRVAVVTGAAQGIGLATAEAFARRGASVVLVDANREALPSALERVRRLNERAVSQVVDVSRKEQLQEMTDRVVADFGRIDILVNNAAVSQTKPFQEISGEEWDWMMAVNVKGVLFACQCVAPIMQAQRYGRIINLGSQAGKTGGILIGAHYSASKAAVMCLTKTLAAALAPYNITVNAVAPGIIDTPFLKTVPGIEQSLPRIPLRRYGEAREVAETIAFLASEEAAYITGEIVDVNGGLLMD